MEDKYFIGETFTQKCNLKLTVLKKTDLKQSGRNPLFLCKFENGEEILCRKDHVLRGTIQNKNKCEEHENEFLFKEWIQNEGHIIIPIKKSKKKISGIYAYEGYIKEYESEGNIIFLKSYAQRGNISNPFTIWRSKEKFVEYLNNVTFEPTIINIANDLHNFIIVCIDILSVLECILNEFINLSSALLFIAYHITLILFDLFFIVYDVI